MKTKDRIVQNPYPDKSSFNAQRGAWEDGFRAGMREVVDSLAWEATPYQTHGGSPVIQVMISEVEWQAKLKEWGIE